MSGARIIWSDESCVLDGVAYSRIPMLIDHRNRVVWPPTDWFRFLCTDGHIKPLSLEDYAYTLAAFWRFSRKMTTPWDDVSDRILRLWINEQRKLEQEPATINNNLNVVVAFYKWAQEYGYVRNIIGLTPSNGLPFPIRLILKSSGGKSAVRQVSHLLLKIPRKTRAPIPTLEEAQDLFAELSSHQSPYIGKRNYLIARLAAGSGLRRTEVLDRKKGELPSRELAEEMAEKDGLCWIKVVGKGSHERRAPILPDVVLELHDFIEEERSELLVEANLDDSEYILISTTTGGHLSGEHVSRLISAAFKAVQLERSPEMPRKLTLQRLRARFASKVVQKLKQDEEARTGVRLVNDNVVLERAATMLGHADPKTLRYYLDSHLDVSTDGIAKAARRSLGQQDED